MGYVGPYKQRVRQVKQRDRDIVLGLDCKLIKSEDEAAQALESLFSNIAVNTT